MNIDIITIFPGMFNGVFSESMLKIAQEKGKCGIALHDLRDWTTDKHRSVDDKPYGGGPGMVMTIEPLDKAIQSLKHERSHIVLLTPQGRTFDQDRATELSKKTHIVLICGHYGGVDARVRDLVDEELSIGDYILTCGELPAMVVTDAITRLLPGVLGDCRSLEGESFENGLLETPRYTRPACYKGKKVPDVLLSGDPAKIAAWEKEQRLRRTQELRPDLITKRQNKCDRLKEEAKCREK